MPPTPNRRAFCLTAAATLATARSQLCAQSRSSTHPDIAAIDHDRILAAASKALTQPITPITSLRAPRSTGIAHDFYFRA